MDMKKDALLCKKFPLLYADRSTSMYKTSMCWGFDIGDGWYQIIHDLSVKLEAMIQQIKDTTSTCECGHDREEHFKGKQCRASHNWQGMSESCPCEEYRQFLPRASQVKEKFGGLRFYMMTSTKEMEKAIHEAEVLCSKTCESCGAPGQWRPLPWQQTLCESHYQEFIDERGYDRAALESGLDD